MSQINQHIFQALGNAQNINVAIDAINSFTRGKMKEDGIWKKVLDGPSIKWMLSYERWLAGERYPWETPREYHYARRRLERQIRSGVKKVNTANLETVHRALNIVMKTLETIERTYGFGM